MRVLVVEDEFANRELLSFLLTHDGYDVTACGSAVEAMAHCREARALYDLIITDVLMPEIDGIAFVRWLRGQVAYRDTIVLCLTALDQNSDYLNAVEAGADGFLRKPYKGQELSRMLTSLNARRRPPALAPAPDFVEPLSEREQDIVALLGQGLNNREIAARLFLSEKTVKNNLTRIYEKLKVDNRTQAVLTSRQWSFARNGHG